LTSGDASTASSRVSTAATIRTTLADGQAIHEVEDVQDVEAWRAEIRR
jgi:hypothetical protein